MQTNAVGKMALDQQSKTGTVGKALGVLELVADMNRPVRFNEILAACDMPKATVYRLVQTLTGEGMLAYDPDAQVYAPGLRLLKLAHSAWSQSSLAQIAEPHIDALSQATGETVHLAQLDNGQVLYLEKRNAAKPISMFAEAGKVGPAYCTGVGKAMLANLGPDLMETAISQQSFHRFTANTVTSADALRRELAEVRKQGLSLDREEHEVGIICLAVPILTVQGKLLGGLSVTSTIEQQPLAEFETAYAEKLKSVAGEISKAAEFWNFPERDKT